MRTNKMVHYAKQHRYSKITLKVSIRFRLLEFNSRFVFINLNKQGLPNFVPIFNQQNCGSQAHDKGMTDLSSARTSTVCFLFEYSIQKSKKTNLKRFAPPTVLYGIVPCIGQNESVK